MGLIKKMWFLRELMLIDKYVKQGSVVPFDDEFYNEMSKFYYNGIPISIHMKYLKPTTKPGKCYDRSLYMFFCFEDAVLVRGIRRDLEIKHGKGHGGHGWIEIGDYVYDPTSLYRFEKDVYYNIYGCRDVEKCNKDTYPVPSYYNEVRNTTIDDYKPGGSKRIELIASIPLAKGIADMSGNQEFINELERHLIDIEYNNDTIMQDIIKEFDNVIGLVKSRKLERG
jgi:hypothetical protein